MSIDLKGKSILILDAYFEPENISFAHLEKDLIEGFINEGMTVRIICPIPTRNISDDIYQEYKRKKYEERFNGKLIIKRFWAPREGKNPLLRAFRYFWCNIRTLHLGKKEKNIDFVFSNSTPPTQGLIAGKIAKSKKVPFIYSLQDIFPDSLVTTGLTKKNSLLWKIGRKIENRTYDLASHIVVISESMRNNLLLKHTNLQKIHVISNWIDIEKVKPIQRGENPLFDEFNISRNEFVVVYAGNMGEAQGVDVILDAARLLINEKITFVMFGGGSEFNRLQSRIENENLSNIKLNHLLPQDRVSDVYSMGNVALITCKTGVGNSGFPSKTWSIMSCNTTIVACFDSNSELKNVLSESNAGFLIEPENPNALARQILFLKSNKYNSNGRCYVLKNASKEKCVSNFLELFNNIIELT